MIGWVRGRWPMLLVAPVLGLMLAASLIAVRAQADALRSRDRTIDGLERRVDSLDVQAKHNGRDLGAARAQIAALAEQVRQLGGKPVVVDVTVPSSSSSSNARPTSSTTSTSTTSTTAPPRPCTVVCLPGH